MFEVTFVKLHLELLTSSFFINGLIFNELFYYFYSSPNILFSPDFVDDIFESVGFKNLLKKVNGKFLLIIILYLLNIKKFCILKSI